jgi:hypothetical protein
MRALRFCVPFLLITACAPTMRGTHMGGKFVSDEAIERVKVCVTRGDEVLASFGEPSSRGRENDFTTYRWIAMTGVTAGTRAMVRSQVIQVWVDGSGRVASIVVNPATMPAVPKTCPTDATNAARAGAKPDRRSADKAKAR